MTTEETPAGAHPMAQWLDAFEATMVDLRAGQVVDGTVMDVRHDEVLIDVGAKAEGLVPEEDLKKLSAAEREALQEGANVRVYILQPESEEGHPLLSISRAKIEEDWDFLEAQRADDATFEAEVTGVNKGGLIVHVGMARGFVPASQVSSVRRRGREEQEVYQRRLAELIGQSLRFKVLEVERDANRLILSERAATREWRRDQKEKLLAELETGMTVTGEVTNLADFGAFVDLGGADGLIHVSELSWSRVGHPSEVVQPGDEVEVSVLNVDQEKQRIGLSLKRLQPEPWTDFVETHEVGNEVEATITKLAPFGAFARIHDAEIEGLIHVSELADAHVEHPSEVVQEGDVVRVEIIRIEPERKRLGLRLRGSEAVDDEDEEDALVWTEDEAQREAV